MIFNNDALTIKEMMQEHKKEKEAFREEMKKKMEKNHINMDDFASNFLTMFNMMSDLANNIDPKFGKKINDVYFSKVNSVDELKQELSKYKKLLRGANEIIEDQKDKLEKLGKEKKEKEDLIKSLKFTKKNNEECESLLKDKIKILNRKISNKNQLQEEVFNKERADLIQANSQLKLKYEKLQSEYDALKKAHVDLVQSITKLAKDNSEF